MTKLTLFASTLLLALALGGTSFAEEDKPADVITSGENYTLKMSGLLYEVLKEGEGDAIKPGSQAKVHYIGWLIDGTKFDSSLDRGEPFTFPLGAGRVIKGWDEGVAGMKVGEQRKLMIPSGLAYGNRQAGSIPPNSMLIFYVELLGIE